MESERSEKIYKYYTDENGSQNFDIIIPAPRLNSSPSVSENEVELESYYDK